MILRVSEGYSRCPPASGPGNEGLPPSVSSDKVPEREELHREGEGPHRSQGGPQGGGGT